MKVFAPKYYKDFKCIADRCRHSCCIGWEIDVDDEAMQRYSALHGYGEEIRKSISGEVPHFTLCEGERCPHLDEQGLCKIIRELGDEYLCDICREHPRFYNETVCGREAGLGLSCEEACRIILTSDEYAEMIVIGKEAGELDISFDAVAEREKIFTILSDRSITYAQRLRIIAGCYDVSLEKLSNREWRELINGLEYLDESHKDLFLGYSLNRKARAEIEKELERTLAYFIYRHASAAENEEEFRAGVGFALFAEGLLASISTEATIFENARIISEELEYSEDNTEAIKAEFYF